MGLDSYFKIKKYEIAEFKTKGLCGGMLSGDGSDGSFRGKVYADLIHDITGLSLYQDEICHEDIVKAATLLKDSKIEDVENNPYALDQYDLDLISSLFQEAAEKEGCVLIGWW